MGGTKYHRFIEEYEPEAALSPQCLLSLLTIMHDMKKEQKSQLIIATHSAILLAYPNAVFFYWMKMGLLI
jgi:predicted ATPase